MTDTPHPDPDVDPWVVPLHGLAFPVTSADLTKKNCFPSAFVR